jgi:hypothetical protein
VEILNRFDSKTLKETKTIDKVIVDRRQDMATANVTNDLEHFVNCGVCFYEFDEENRKPKFLQCAHTFCLKCLQVYKSFSYCISTNPNSRLNDYRKYVELAGLHALFAAKHSSATLTVCPTIPYSLQMVKLKEEREKPKVTAVSPL